ncbi:MAG: YihY family inner membrane protein [Planctomycetes bacterium]|nr:YihY family inner membrane protein [Planctomycetota bacterium]
MNALRQFSNDFLHKELDEFPRGLRFVISQLRLYTYIGKQLFRDNCLERACALAYTTVLAIVPVVTVAFAFYRSFTGLEGIEDMVKQRMLDWFLAQSHIVDTVGKQALQPKEPPKALPEAPPAKDQNEEATQEQTQKILENYAGEIASWIKKLSDQLSSRVVGVASMLFLVLASIFLLNTIEGAFNNIWHVAKRRSFIYKMCIFWVIITLGPAFIGASFVLTSRVQEWFELWPKLSLIGRVLFRMLPILSTCVAFFLMYVLIPNVKVRWRSAIAGAIVAGILWEFAKVGFSLYVTKVMFMYSQTYGTLALIPIFLLWLFLTWLIVLFGVEVTYTSQNFHSLRSEDRRAKHGSAPPESIAMRLVLLVARTFTEGGEQKTLQTIAREMGLAEDEVRPIGDRLIENGILTTTTNGPDPVFLPAKSTDSIRVRDVIKAASMRSSQTFSSRRGEERLSELFKAIDSATESLIGDLTFRDLLEKPKAPQEPA